MSSSTCFKCYPWSYSPSLPFFQKPTSYFSISFSSTQQNQTQFPLSHNFTPTQLLDTLRRQNDESSALRLFDWASKQPNFTPNLSIYEELLTRLGKHGSFDSMKHILQQMKLSGCELRRGTFLILVESYADFDLYDEILDVVELMESEFGLKSDTHFYNFLLNVLVDGNKLKLVEAAHNGMVSRGVKPDVSTFNILIKALCNAHQIRPAILMMEEMPSYGLSPDEKTFTTIMQGFIDEGNLDGALRIREQMVEAGQQVTNVTVNVLVHGFCKEGRIEEALDFIQIMTNEGFYPDQFTFNTLVNGLCKAGYVKHALEIMDAMLQEGFNLDIFTYNSLISGLCKIGEIEEAVEILNQMILRDCSPNTVTYNTLISTLCKENQVEEATELARVLTTLFRRKRTNEAMRLYREMLEKGDPPDAISYKIVFRGLCNGGGPIGEAVDFVVEMIEKGFLPEFSSFYMLAEGLCSLSMEDTLVKLIDMVMEKANCSDSEVSIIRGFLRIRKFQDALAILGNILDSKKPKKSFSLR
ncbi:hypothetical protein POUND7_001957 [Theobroma cacao]